MTFTKERIIEELKASTQNACGMFEINEDTICALMELLESRADAEPVTYDQAQRDHMKDILIHKMSSNLTSAVPLVMADIHAATMALMQAGFRVRPQPAPGTVQDDHHRQLSELYHAQEKRLFKLAQRIKGPTFDKYAYSPSQAIDVLEAAIFGEKEDNGSVCRAAMLKGKSANMIIGDELPHDPQIAAYEKIMEQAIHAGWKLVPVIPSPSQWAAGQKAFDSAGINKVDAIYKAMVAAATQQEANNG